MRYKPLYCIHVIKTALDAVTTVLCKMLTPRNQAHLNKFLTFKLQYILLQLLDRLSIEQNKAATQVQ